MLSLPKSKAPSGCWNNSFGLHWQFLRLLTKNFRETWSELLKT